MINKLWKLFIIIDIYMKPKNSETKLIIFLIKNVIIFLIILNLKNKILANNNM